MGGGNLSPQMLVDPENRPTSTKRYTAAGITTSAARTHTTHIDPHSELVGPQIHLSIASQTGKQLTPQQQPPHLGTTDFVLEPLRERYPRRKIQQQMQPAEVDQRVGIYSVYYKAPSTRHNLVPSRAVLSRHQAITLASLLQLSGWRTFQQPLPQSQKLSPK